MWNLKKRKQLCWMLVMGCFFNVACNKTEECNYVFDYYPYMIKAEIAYEEANYPAAYDFMKMAFDRCAPRNTRTYYEIDKMAKICAHLGLAEESTEMIRQQIQRGFTLSKYQDDPVFKQVLASEPGRQLVSEYESLREKYMGTIDKELVQQLVRMSSEDQKYRGSGAYQEWKTEQELIDSQNEELLINIFESYGYPEEHLMRYSYPDRITLETILLHTGDSIRMSYFLPKLKWFVENGNCDPKVYAEVFDQHQLYNGQPQQYGTYNDREGNLSTSIALDQVEANRENIGLPSLEDKAYIHQLKIKNYPNTYGRFFKN